MRDQFLALTRSEMADDRTAIQRQRRKHRIAQAIGTLRQVEMRIPVNIKRAIAMQCQIGCASHLPQQGRGQVEPANAARRITQSNFRGR